jgi:hypothetical protein
MTKRLNRSLALSGCALGTDLRDRLPIGDLPHLLHKTKHKSGSAPGALGETYEVQTLIAELRTSLPTGTITLRSEVAASLASFPMPILSFVLREGAAATRSAEMPSP